MTTLRWLHLSDFHTGKDGYGQSRLFQYILEHVKSRVEAALSPDFVFITGDIANKGQGEQYQEFNENFLLPLIGLLPPECQSRVYLIPGNHDVDRNQTRAVQTYGVLVKIPDFFDPSEKGQFERSQSVLPRFRAYAENDMINTGEHWLFSQGGVFSHNISFNGKTIGVLGINTAWLSCSDYDRHQLSTGKPLLEDGLEKIRDCDLKFVLGHHPLDWFLDEELEPVRSLLGRHNVIYLHGHMHKGRARHEEGAGYPFLALQSGACFQAREDELWVNRFLWCEMDLKTHEISAEPLQWSHDNHEWTLDPLAFPEKYRKGDRWIISLPSPAPVEGRLSSGKAPAQKFREMPKGWVIVDRKYLKSLANELTAEQALSFFDGRAPIWREALAPQIPKREIVNSLVGDLDAARKAGGLQVILLIGAAGEGKTTALLQTICDLVNSSHDWHVLWHDDPGSPFSAEFIARLPKGGTWLIASDDAELIARRVYETTQLLTDRNDIQFLLCSRDTDWKAAGADRFNWKQNNIKFTQLSLRGLSLDDAEQVVLAWSKYGKDGLKQLNNLTAKEASMRLIEAAKSEETNRSEGSFFGSVLQVRLGDGFKDHIRTLLEKLSVRSNINQKTLRDAFMYIAAMHAEGLQFLSKEVLADVLEVDLSNLKRGVLFPLGEEAAIATTGRFVFTRHRSIATVAVQILSDEFDIDPENLFRDLMQSAIRIGSAGSFIPEYSRWVYLCDHFFDKGDLAFSIRLAQAVLEITPNDPFSIVKLAQLYREAGQSEQSIQIFRSIKSKIQRNERALYSEWAASEGSCGNLALSVWLYAYSISDEVARQPPDNHRTQRTFNSMAFTFSELYENFHLKVYIEACGALVQLCSLLNLDTKSKEGLNISKTRAKVAGVEDVSLEIAFQHFREGIVSAWEDREDELPKLIPPAHNLNFHGLARLLSIAN